MWAYREYDEDCWEVYDEADEKRNAYVGSKAVAQEMAAALNAVGSLGGCATCAAVRALVAGT